MFSGHEGAWNHAALRVVDDTDHGTGVGLTGGRNRGENHKQRHEDQAHPQQP